MFWVFHVVRDYAHTLKEGDSRHAPRLPDLLARAARLEEAVGPIDVVFGHNDLLAANFIDDGKRLWLVDWEYAGFNSPLFDLGGLASNSELRPAQAEQALSLYFGRPVDDALRRRAAAMAAASLLRETMWSMVSEIYSTVDFDYGAYTAENMRRFEAAYAAFAAMDGA
jgi:thiamine kinase-like enzyme